MTTKLLTEKYADDLYGTLSCYDRVIITGHVQQLSYAQGMTSYLYQQKIRIFDYTKLVEPLRKSIRENAEAIAKENDIDIEFVRKTKHFRKEKRIKQILRERGAHPGLVHIFSAMESCSAYKSWHNKQTGKNYVKSTSAKCLHYYFYFMDEVFGLCYMRVPTWAPFRLQFYFNGHNYLASQLEKEGIGFTLKDNAFLQIDDFERANQVANEMNAKQLHAKLDSFAQKYCPVVHRLNLKYNWSIMQAEYATDLVFKKQRALQAFYHPLLETLIQAIKPADIATFLGRKMHGNYQGEMGNRFNVRWLGSRIRHQMGPISIKMYDKFNIVLRIETTANQVSFFKQYRRVNHRDGSFSTKWAHMKKTIYSLAPLRENLSATNLRYLKFISTIDTPEVGTKKLQRLAETKEVNNHRHKGFNLFAEEDASLFRTLLRGEFFISGFANKDLLKLLSGRTSEQITRLLKRLRVHGLIKKVGRTYKYYLTKFGIQVVAMALKLRKIVVIPELARTYSTAP